MLVYGWGEANGVKFWKVKNSWGPAWGEMGHFRVQRGKNLLEIERRCFWASPFDTWTSDVRNNTVPTLSTLGSFSY